MLVRRRLRKFSRDFRKILILKYLSDKDGGEGSQNIETWRLTGKIFKNKDLSALLRCSRLRRDSFSRVPAMQVLCFEDFTCKILKKQVLGASIVAHDFLERFPQNIVFKELS